MPAGRRKQSNTMLYTLVTFVGLLIIATAAAIIFYVKFEEQRSTAIELKSDLDNMATEPEIKNIATIVGEKKSRETYLGKMVEYLDKMVSSIIGPLGELKDSSAEVKIQNANQKVLDTITMAQEYTEIQNADPNTTGLIPVIEKLQAQLARSDANSAAFEEQLKKLQQRFDDTMKATKENEKKLLAEKEQYHQDVNDITQKYEELKALVQKTSDAQVQILIDQLEEERSNLKKTNDELLRTQAELQITQDRMRQALEELQQIKPSPDREVAAYQPDGKVILIDEVAQVVHLNIGSDDHVYQGLTFSVYDRNSAIPKDGKGKAEVEVFGLSEKISTARILNSQKKNPIAINDPVANLVWDSDQKNVFVIAGEFDVNGDEIIDRNGIEKITSLITQWGGTVADTISVDTDFLVLGKTPQVPRKPTFEELEADPLANERYEAAFQKFNRYNEIQSQAQAFWIPIFTYDRFLYFIGYKGNIDQPGAF